MSNKKQSKRQQAFDIFKENNGKIDLIEIARLLNSPPGTVRGWKSKDKWDDQLNGTFHDEKRNAPIKETERSDGRGAPPGNKNAIGNRGGAPPKHNKNAVTTGEHETIFEEFLSDEEKDIYSIMSDDPFFIMSEEVRLLKIRQRRMMLRIKNIEDGLTESEFEYLQELRGKADFLDNPKKKSKPELIVTSMKEKIARKIDDVLRIEDALTRVSNQLQKAIKQLNELILNEQRLELMKAQTDHTKAQTTKALINKDGDENDGGTVINIIDDIG